MTEGEYLEGGCERLTTDRLASLLANQNLEWAEFRADMRERFAQQDVRMAQLETRLTR